MRTSLADPALHLVLVGAALLVILSAPLCWLVGSWVRSAGGWKAPPAPVPARLARIAAGAAIAALALAAIGAGGMMVTPSWLAKAVATGPLALFSLGALATGATVGYATLGWRRRWWNLAERIHFSAVAAALATLVTLAGCYLQP